MSQRQRYLMARTAAVTEAPRSRAPEPGLILERDPAGLERLKFQSEGWKFWEWAGHNIHYVQAGSEGPPVLLIHGFGASAYHWRYNIPFLAKKHRVYAIDLLGFGWSPKALVDYNGYGIWSDQLSSFIRDVIVPECGSNPVLVGNSLGGYNALSTAARHPDLVRGVVLMNGAGRFDDLDVPGALESADEVSLDLDGELSQKPPADPWSLAALMKGPLELFSRAAVYVSFVFAKQPARIRSVLMQVYADPTNVDDDLVLSISQPAASSANAPEVFRRIITGSGISINRLLRRTQAPLLLLWGDQDPWIRPASADKVMALYPSAQRIRLNAGHCPHDEVPQAANEALESWLATLDA